MKRRPPLLWIILIGLLMLLAPLALLWRLTGRPQASVPIEAFLPRRASAAVCLRQAQQAWQRHWHARPGPAPEDALKAIYLAADKWDRQVEKHGEIQARLRLGLFQQAFFQAVGEEAWAVFGEWGGERPGAGQVGLMIFLRGDTPVKSRVTPLLDLLLGDYKIKRTHCEGEVLLEYEGKAERRNISFCQIGGWICVSLRQAGTGPLPAIIRQVRAVIGGTTTTLGDESFGLPTAPAGSAVQGLLRPAVFWEQLGAFNSQRGHKLSKKSRASLKDWQQRLEGIETVTLHQAGASIFDCILAAEGPRIARINHEARVTTSVLAGAEYSGTVPSPARGLSPNTPPAFNELAQIDCDAPAARASGSFTGGSWGELLKDSKNMDLVLPGLRKWLEEMLAGNKTTPAAGRIGLAAYPSPVVLVPYVMRWQDRGPHAARSAPAPARLAGLLDQNGSTSSAAECQWVGAAPAGALPLATAQVNYDYATFTGAMWQMADTLPLAFAGINFRALGDELAKVPTIFMKKDKRKDLERWKSVINTLGLSVGCAAARIDGAGERWVMTVRTP